MPEFIRESWPKSRGKVRCELCGRTIASGVLYHQITSTDMGHIATYRRCQTCDEASENAYEWLDLETGIDDPPEAQDIEEWARWRIKAYPTDSWLARRWLEIMRYETKDDHA